MRNPIPWLGLAAVILWGATLVLTLAYNGNGSPVGQGLVMLLAIVVTLGLADRIRRSRCPGKRDGAAHSGTWGFLAGPPFVWRCTLRHRPGRVGPERRRR